MSYQSFMQEIYRESENAEKSIQSDSQYAEYNSLHKHAHDLADNLDQSLLSEYDLSSYEMSMARKIASEIEQITHKLRIQPVSDKDYESIMKTADCQINTDKTHPLIGKLFASTIQKIASEKELDQVEEMYIGTDFFQNVSGVKEMAHKKQAGIAEKLVSLGQKMGANKPVSKPYLGSIGSYALASVPLVGTGAYLAGNSKGRQQGKQDVANELADKLRYYANIRNAESNSDG